MDQEEHIFKSKILNLVVVTKTHGRPNGYRKVLKVNFFRVVVGSIFRIGINPTNLVFVLGTVYRMTFEGKVLLSFSW